VTIQKTTISLERGTPRSVGERAGRVAAIVCPADCMFMTYLSDETLKKRRLKQLLA
jgi:hypothetical protein